MALTPKPVLGYQVGTQRVKRFARQAASHPQTHRRLGVGASGNHENDSEQPLHDLVPSEPTSRGTLFPCRPVSWAESVKSDIE